MELKKTAINTGILKTFRDAGAECERAELGASNAIYSASMLIIEKLELKPNDILDFVTYTSARDAFVAGYFMQYGRSRGITMTDEEKEKARSSADSAAFKVRRNLEEYGIVIQKSETPEAKKKREQREKKKAEQASQDGAIVNKLRARMKAEGVDAVTAANEIARGNIQKVAQYLAALERVDAVENKAQIEQEKANLKTLRDEVRAKVKTADVDCLRAMLAC